MTGRGSKVAAGNTDERDREADQATAEQTVRRNEEAAAKPSLTARSGAQVSPADSLDSGATYDGSLDGNGSEIAGGHPEYPSISSYFSSPFGADALREDDENAAHQGVTDSVPLPDSHANDDDNALGNIVYFLERSPSSTPLWASAALSCLWALLVVILARGAFWAQPEGIGGISDFVSGPTGMAAAAATIGIPVFLFFSIAILIRRSQRLGFVSKAMTDLALRLAAPESLAQRSITTVGQAVRREVSAMSTGMENAIRRASELESHLLNELVSLERSYVENEEKLKKLTADLTSHREAIVEQSAEVRSSLFEVHETISHDITQTQATMSKALQATANELSHALTHSASDFTDRVTETTNSLMSNVKRLQKHFSEEVQSQVDGLNESMERTQVDVNAAVTTNFEKLGGKFGDVSSKTATELTTHVDSLLNQLSRQSTAFSDGVVATLSEATRCANEIGEKLMNELNVNVNTLAEGLNAACQRVVGDLATSGDAIRTQLDGVVMELSNSGDMLATTLSEKSQSVVQTFDTLTSTFSEFVDDRATKLEEHVTRSSGAFQKTINLSSDALSADFSRLAADFSQKMSSEMQGARDVLTDHVTKIDLKITEYGENIRESENILTESLSKSGENLSEVVSEKSEIYREEVSRISDQLEEVVGSGTARLEGRIVENLEQLNTVAVQFQTSLTQHTDDLGKGLEESKRQFTVFSTELAGKIISIDKNLTASMATMGTTLDTRTHEMVERFESGVESLQSAVTHRFDSFTQAIETGQKDISSALDQKLFHVTSVIDERVGHLGTMVQVNLGSIVDGLEEKVNAVSNMVGGELDGIVSAIDSKATSASTEFVRLSEEAMSRLEIATKRAGELLNERMHFLEQALEENQQNVDATFERERERIRDQISEMKSDIVENLDQGTRHVSSAIEQSSAKAVASISHSGQDAVKELASILERTEGTVLRLSNNAKKFSEFLQNVVGGMRTFEDEVESRISGLKHALSLSTANSGEISDQIRAQVGDLSEVTGGMLKEVGSLNSQLAGRIKAMETCAQTLTDAQQHMGVRIEDQQKAVSSMSRNIQGNLEALCDHLAASVDRIEKSFGTFEQRAHGLAENIVRISEQATESVGKEFEQLGTRTAMESGKTRGVLENLSKTILEDVGEMRAAITRENQKAVADIRSTLTDVSGEVGGAVSGVNDKIGSLSTQIRHLKADVSEPALTSSPSSESANLPREGRAPAINRLARRNRSGGGRERAGAPTRLQLARESERSGRYGRGEWPAEPEAEERREAETERRDWASTGREKRSGSGTGPTGRGWLRGFLGNGGEHSAIVRKSEGQRNEISRDSREKRGAGRTTDDASGIPPLEKNGNGNGIDAVEAFSFASDISQSVKTDEVAHLWRGFQRGESDLFGEHLYTHTGKDVLRSVRARYRKETAFRESIDRYINDYETMLTRVVKEDKAPDKVFSHLISPTGRAYTLLLHASGREF